MEKNMEAVVDEASKPEETGAPIKYEAGKQLNRYIIWSMVVSLVVAAAWTAVPSILLPNQVQSIEFARWFTGANANVDLTALTNLKDAVANGATITAAQQHLLDILKQFDSSRASALSIISAISVFCTMLIQPIVGSFSDRTRSRFGRRAPWILLGSVIGAIFLALMSIAPSIAILTVFWALAQTLVNVASGPLNTTVADRVPESQIGNVSAMIAIAAMLGGIAGAIVAGILFAKLGLSLYVFTAILIVIGFVVFVFKAPDKSSVNLAVKPIKWSGFLKGFLVPLKDRDFRFVWLARLILTFGYSSTSALSLYMLQSYIHPALSAAEATKIVPIISATSLPCMLIAMVISGKLSDKSGKRKPFVFISSIVMAVGMLVPLFFPTLPALFIEYALAGIAMGIYLPVDQALFIDVLPDKNSAGRDLGIGAMASSCGQALGPIMAGQIVAVFSSYGLIWPVAAVLCIISAVIILPVKRVN